MQPRPPSTPASRFVSWIVGAVLIATLPAGAGPLPSATEMLAAYVRIDTSNPPGHTDEAAVFWERFFAAEGIPTERILLGPRKPAVLARIGSGPSVVLIHHMDVVPAEADEWDVAPFAGEIRDGVLYGRGVLDMKGLGVLQALAMARLHRDATELSRQIAFLAIPDEEVGSVEGARPFVENHWDTLGEPGILLNEGGGGSIGVLSEDVPVMAIGVADRHPLWLRVKARGRSGHGSAPHPDGAAEILARALTRVADWEPDGEITPVTAAMFSGISHLQPFPLGFVLRNAGSFWAKPFLTFFLGRIPEMTAMVRSTCSLTGLRAGLKTNVIPALGEATLDCRLLPRTDPDAFLAELRDVVDDERITFEIELSFDAADASPWNTRDVSILREVIDDHLPDAVTVPMMNTGFTDSAHFRARGLPSYGFFPVVLELDEGRSVHNRNERIRVSELERGDRIYTDAVRRLARAGHAEESLSKHDPAESE